MSTTLTGQIVARHKGIAGQYAISVSVNYWHDDHTTESHVIMFVGSSYGAPVVMVADDSRTQTLVDDWQQYGETLDSDWVRRFYGAQWISAKTFTTSTTGSNA